MNYYIPSTDTVNSDKITGQIINKKLDLDLNQAVGAFNKYYKTLKLSGFIDREETNIALVYTFMVNYYIKSDVFGLDDNYKRDIFKIFNCLYNKACIFKN